MGVRLLGKLAEDLEEFGQVESSPRQDGRNMVMVLGPLKTKSEAKSAARRAKEAESDQESRLPSASLPSRRTPISGRDCSRPRNWIMALTLSPSVTRRQADGLRQVQVRGGGEGARVAQEPVEHEPQGDLLARRPDKADLGDANLLIDAWIADALLLR
jgi:hypothetical protein